MQENDQNQYAFIKEKIKEKPVNKKKMMIQAGFVLAMAILFGLVASFVIAYFTPRMEQSLYPQENQQMNLPADESGTESVAEATETEEAGEENGQETPETGNAEGEEGTPEGTVQEQNEPIDMIQWQPTLEDYQSLQNQIYAVGVEANKFMVTVTGVQSSTDWFNNAYESKDRSSGIIIGNTGGELLILTQKKVISNAEEIYVTFTDNTMAQAELRKYDGNTGITVLSVPTAQIEETTMSAVSVAVLGSSVPLKQGTMVIAVGSPLGVDDSILTGNMISNSNTISLVDANYDILMTDIVGSSNGSGALINLKGEVIGLMMQEYSNAGNTNTLTAVSISDIKALIDKLSGNQEIAYLGLGITTVTSNIEKEYEIPKGVYIKEVKMDSPAMAAGLQSGDVIVEMDGMQVLTEEAYERKILELSPGDVVEVIIKRQGNEGYVNIRCGVEAGSLK